MLFYLPEDARQKGRIARWEVVSHSPLLPRKKASPERRERVEACAFEGLTYRETGNLHLDHL